MELPDFLATDDGGFIHVTGRRIGLHHIIRAYHEGLSPEEIAIEYSSLQLSIVHKVIAYYLEHLDEVDQYAAEHDAIIAKHTAESKPGPNIEELRTRLARQQKSSSQSV